MKKEKIIILIITTIFIAIIFPMIYIAKYNHSSADDYSYGVETHKTWEETHSIIKVIEKGIEKTKNIYNDWQGSFSAVFLMAIQPAVFGEKIYAITPIIIMGIFIISNMYTLKIILKNYFKCNNISYIMIAFAIILMSIEFVTYPVESFYWYNGSIYYTFFYSLMILMFGIMLKMLKEEKISKKDIITSTILAFLIGGSNYTTALITNIILFLITIVLMYKKDKKSKYILLLLISSFISLIISCIAPGNSVRQSGLVK